jgi:hypothetical protein
MFEDISGKSHIHLGLTAIALKTMRVLIAYDLRPVSAPRLISKKKKPDESTGSNSAIWSDIEIPMSNLWRRGKR